MAVNPDRFYVTYVEAYHGLLKIWGQPNRTCASYIEKQLLQLASELNRSPGLNPSIIQKGMICIAKYEDENYYRARIISDVVNNAVFVHFIDYGNKDRVDLCNLRLIGRPTENFLSTIVPQAEDYVLANIKYDGGWPQEVMKEIRRALCYSEYNYRTVCLCGKDKLIQISYQNEDYSSYLIRQEIAKPVSLKEQMILLKTIFENQSMEPMGSTFRSPNYNQQLPQPPGRDMFFIPNMVQLGATAHNRFSPPGLANSQPLLPQPIFAQPQHRSGMDRHFNIMNPPPKAGFSQSSNAPMLSDLKCPSVINNVVIEALANQLKQHLLKDQSTSGQEISTHGYVTQVLDVKTTHNVYVSYIDDGPWSFSVQLVSNEHELNQLMEDLASYSFQSIKLPLILGSPCIAKSKKYENYCRGVLVNITHSAVKVFYVDFGNTEDLPYNMLFEIPQKFFKFKTMSQKFALSGLQRVKPTEEIKRAFTEVVENELLILHVTNLEGENLPTCDLYLKDVNIKKILNEKLRLVKNWDPIQFPCPGDLENVLVTCVETPQRFFVQLKKYQPELRELKAELAKFGANAESLAPEEIVSGIICICYYTREKNWYRAVVTSVNSSKTVTVFYVDYGYTEMVDIRMLRKVSGGVIVKMKVQAIPCCLHGYEGGLHQSSNKPALTELILGREFILKVVSEGKECINVQLLDNGRDVLLGFQNVTLHSPKSQSYDTKDKSDNYASDSDSVKKRSIPSGRTESDRFDWDKGQGKKDLKPEKGKGDLLSWRSEDRKESGLKPKDNSKNIKAWDVREPGSETKNEKYNGRKADDSKAEDSKSGRYGFKTKKQENLKGNDKDVEKNWRGTGNVGSKTAGGDGKYKNIKSMSINDRMKKVARENEERGRMMSEPMVVTRLPVKLDDIAFGGKVRENTEVKIGTTEKVLVTYFVNPNEFYVQLISWKERIKEFMFDIRDYYSTKLPMLNKPKKGDVLMCKFKQDGFLYRAVVIKNDPITVHYVDFGNEEVSEREDLWVMDKRFLVLESQCLKCIIPNIKPVGSDTWPPPCREMDKIFESETYSCTFLKKTENCYEVTLVNLENGRDVGDELISAGFACSVKTSAKSFTEASVNASVNNWAKASDQDFVENSVQNSAEDSMQNTVQDYVSGSFQISAQISDRDSFQISLQDSVQIHKTDTKEIPLPMIKLKNCTNTPFDLLRDEIFNVFVTHIVNASEFYVQIKSSELTALEKDILKFVGGEEFRRRAGRVSVNNENLCLVNVGSNDWYRAQVIEKGQTNITVSLIDHGYSLPVNREQIGPISNHLARYSPQAIRCCLLIGEDKPIHELNQDFSSCVKKNFSAFFHEESDKGLKVTLYDTFGEKLKILNRYNSAPVWIRAISDLPIVKRRMQVAVSHIDSPKEIYVQLLNDVEELKRLISLMTTYYSDKEKLEPSGNLSDFEMYAAQSLTDGTWYRAQLISQNEKAAKMFYLDFGSAEEVPRKNLRKLDPSFCEWYAFAKKVSLNLSYPRNAEKRITNKLQKLIAKRICPAYFAKMGDNLYAEFVVEDSFLTSQLVTGSIRTLKEGMFEKYKTKISEEEIKVFVSYVSRPEEIWVHEEAICSDLSAFQDTLQAACLNGKPKNDIAVGDVVGALFRDNVWYRALITATEGDIISIRFLDYGNSFDIDKRENVLIALPDELQKRDSFARRCSLQGSWKKNTTYRLEDMVLNNVDTLELVEINDEGDIVDLLQNGTSITEQLVNEGYGGSENDDIVFITHINSPTDFYVQRASDQNLFDTVIEKMAEANSLQDSYDVIVNELYCARFPEDGLWYRAKVICKDGDEVVVSFVDYGNCSIVTEMKDLPDDLRTLRPLSTNCCLVNVGPKDSWSEAEKNCLGKFLNSVPLKMEVVQQTSEIDVIRLTTENGEDLSEMLSSEGGVCPKPEYRFGSDVNGANPNPLLLEETAAPAAHNDSSPSEEVANISAVSALPEKSQNTAILSTGGVIPGGISQGESSSKKDEKPELGRKSSCPKNVVAGSVIKDLPPEEVSNPGYGKVKAKAPARPSAAERKKHERRRSQLKKTSPGTVVSNGSTSVSAQDKIVQNGKRATPKRSGNAGGKKN